MKHKKEILVRQWTLAKHTRVLKKSFTNAPNHEYNSEDKIGMLIVKDYSDVW